MNLGIGLRFVHVVNKSTFSLNSDKKVSKNIHSISELVIALSEGERTTYSNIIHSLDIPLEDFKNYASWSLDCYTRNCIFECEKYELILLCWEPEQKTPIHDHGGEECWVRVIQGELKEVIFKIDEGDQLRSVKSEVSKINDVSYMIDFMGVHSLQNNTKQRSMSLHLYAKPIKTCNKYDEALGEWVNKTLSYTTIPASIEH